MLAGALLTILGADLILARLNPSWILGGAIDEPAHLATGAIVLANLPPAGPIWSAAYVFGCVAVDADHCR